MGQLAEAAVQFGGGPQIWQVQRQPELQEICLKNQTKLQKTNKQTENGGEGRNQHVVLDYDSHAVAADK